MDIDSIAILVKRVSLEFDKMAATRLKQYGITPSQYKVLKLIVSSPEHTVRQVDVERRFSMTNPTVTGIVRNLEHKGLIKRGPNPNDARSKVLDLTERSAAMKDELISAGSEMENEFTRSLTEEEKQQAKVILRKLLE